MRSGSYELTGDWKPSNIGHTAKATKDGKTYFLKRYGDCTAPTGEMTDKMRRQKEAKFKSFRDNRVAINRALMSLAGPGGNIILPTDWFVDGAKYIEASEFVPGLIEDEEILALSKDEKLFVMRTTIAAVAGIHRVNIVHSDLKRTNILAARNSAGNIVGKIIDFDRSFFANDIRPMELGGDWSFMSPELLNCFYAGCADDPEMNPAKEEALSYLSTKSDIFSLGLVFHDYLAGVHPQIVGLTGKLKEKADRGKTIYCSEALLGGGELVIDSRVDEKYLSHLLVAMLQLEPTDRPTAMEVLEVLKSKRVLPLKAGSKVKIEGEEAGPEGFCDPWEEHGVKFKEDEIKRQSFTAAERLERSGKKCYQLYREDGAKRVFTVEQMIMLGMAERKGSGGSRATYSSTPTPPPTSPITTVTDDGSMWEPESRDFKLDLGKAKSSGYVGVAKAEKNGVKGYVLIKADGSQKFMNFGALKMLGYAVKK